MTDLTLNFRPLQILCVSMEEFCCVASESMVTDLGRLGNILAFKYIEASLSCGIKKMTCLTFIHLKSTFPFQTTFARSLMTI